jgi:hypothetical protein
VKNPRTDVKNLILKISIAFNAMTRWQMPAGHFLGLIQARSR